MKKLADEIWQKRSELIIRKIKEYEVVDAKGVMRIVKELNTSYNFVVKIAGKLIKEQRDAKTKKIIEEYKRIGRNILKKNLTKKEMDELVEIVIRLAARNGCSQFFAFRALGNLFPYYSPDGHFELEGEVYLHPKRLAQEFGEKNPKTVANIVWQLKVRSIKILTPKNTRLINFYSFSDTLMRCFKYARNYRINQCFQDKNVLTKLRAEKPPNMRDEELLALAMLTTYYDIYRIWLKYKELVSLLAEKGIKDGYVIIRSIIKKGFIRHREGVSKCGSPPSQVFEISSKCPPSLVYEYVKCFSPDCFYCRDGKKHKIRKHYVFDSGEELQEKWNALAPV